MSKRARRPFAGSRPPAPSSPDEPDTGGFAELVEAFMTPGETAGARAVEPLARLDYARELDVKNRALAAFWQHHGLTGTPAPIVPSPLPRHYRTTTRRRARYRGGVCHLGFGVQRGSAPTVPDSALEPEAHTALYRYLAEELSASANHPIALRLNHVVIRGSYTAFSVILNLDELTSPVVRRLKALATRLQARPENVISAFVFCDPSRSEYYFEREPPPVPVRLKRLFGPARFPLAVAGRRYALPPTSFSQVNESMIEPMLAATRSLLEPQTGDRLLDLYCGYGLFSHDLSDTCAEVEGLDLDRGSIQAAQDQLRFSQPAGRVTFACRDITPESLDRALAHAPGSASARELVVLDPPRQGPGRGVITQLAHRRPDAVVHIFCGIESIPTAIAEWTRHGFDVADCTPLDMFAGTPNLETLILLQPRDTRH